MTMSRRILAAATTLSFLLTSFAASVHVHRPVVLENPGEYVAACSCLGHIPQPQSSDPDSSPEHDSDSCLICKFIAESGTHNLTQLQIANTPMLIGTLPSFNESWLSNSQLTYRGRAPPSSDNCI